VGGPSVALIAGVGAIDWRAVPAMPVPPIFQPELPGRAIVYLAEHPRRNMWVGISTAYTIVGERLAPKLLDLYLGRSGVIRDAGRHRVGSEQWWHSVRGAREANSDHMAEEEREALADFRRHASLQDRLRGLPGGPDR
jgi:hypothetical protein